MVDVISKLVMYVKFDLNRCHSKDFCHGNLCLK